MNTAEREAGNFDKALLTISLATFAISIGFIGWLQQVNAPIPKDWAVAAWVCMPASIACVVATFHFSTVAGVTYARRVDELVASPSLYTDDAFSSNPAYVASKSLHVLGGVLFLAGLVAFTGLMINGLLGAPIQ